MNFILQKIIFQISICGQFTFISFQCCHFICNLMGNSTLAHVHVHSAGLIDKSQVKTLAFVSVAMFLFQEFQRVHQQATTVLQLNIVSTLLTIAFWFCLLIRYRTYCLIGDGESAEGSIWEACAFASYYKLDNLVAIFDVNRLGQSQAASLEHSMDVYQARLSAFG